MLLSPVMSRTSPGQTVSTQKAARRHSTTFSSSSDWSVTTMEARGTEELAASPERNFSTGGEKGCQSRQEMNNIPLQHFSTGDSRFKGGLRSG